MGDNISRLIVAQFLAKVRVLSDCAKSIYQIIGILFNET